MYCRSCGEPLDANAAFCPRCGAAQRQLTEGRATGGQSGSMPDWLAVLLLFFLFPLGFIPMWLGARWSRDTKLAITGFLSHQHGPRSSGSNVSLRGLSLPSAPCLSLARRSSRRSGPMPHCHCHLHRQSHCGRALCHSYGKCIYRYTRAGAGDRDDESAPHRAEQARHLP